MQSYTIGEFKRRLPEILHLVSEGESVLLQKGRSRRNVAVLSPYAEEDLEPRKLGVLSPRGQPIFKNWEISEGELLDG